VRNETYDEKVDRVTRERRVEALKHVATRHNMTAAQLEEILYSEAAEGTLVYDEYYATLTRFVQEDVS
jgi:hypothetical protein